jgi:uncharacterized protein (TIGR02597 family)
MNSLSSFRSPLCALTALLTFGLGFQAQAQSVTTTPVGAVTVTIGAGTGTVRNATVASFPLINSSVTSGITTGSITSVTSNTIAATSAGWVAGDLSQPAVPYLVKITSGAAVGRTFLISSNTTDTLTISTSDGVSNSVVNLVQLGVLTGDKFQIENADTLLSMFGVGDTVGSSGPLGNSNPSLADTIQLNISNAYQTYYYDPAQASWINFASEARSNNVVIRPDTAVIYNRLKNTAFTITLTGVVPATSRKAVIRSGQTTILSSYWPSDTTLTSLGLQNISGWVSSSNPNIADLVQMRIGTSWQTFYFDGNNWINFASEATSNNVSVPAASGLIIKKRAITGDSIIFSKPIAYNL